MREGASEMNTIIIKKLKLSMSESALHELQLRSQAPSANVAQMVEVLTNDKQTANADDMAWAQNRARELGFVPVSEVTR